MAYPFMGAVILRLGMVYGSKDPNHRFFNPIQKMSRGDQEIVLSKDYAHCQMSKCYVKNVAYGIKLAVESDVTSEIFNLSDSIVLSEAEWYQQIAELMQWKGRLVIEDRLADAEFNFEQSLVVDTSKIQQQLAYKEPFSIQEALLDTISWELEQLD